MKLTEATSIKVGRLLNERNLFQYSFVDVCAIFSDSKTSRNYWNYLKKVKARRK